MAFSILNVKNIDNVNVAREEEAFTSLTTALATNGETTATFGACFDMSERDDKYMILLYNSDTNSQKVTVHASNAMQGVNDLEVTLASGKYTVLGIDSGRFKWVSQNGGYCDKAKTIPHAIATQGFTEKGKVFITAQDADVKVAVFKLPV